MRTRARLTLVDIVLVAATIAVLAFVLQPYYSVMQSYSSELDTGTRYLLYAVPPGLVASILVVTYTTALGRSPR